MNNNIKNIFKYFKHMVVLAVVLVGVSLSVFGLERDKNGVYQISSKEDLFEFSEKFFVKQ